MIQFFLFFFDCASAQPNLTEGVPYDIFSLLPVERSADFGLYSQCELPRGSGLLSGACVPVSYFSDKMPFCGEHVTYPACVPPGNPVWPEWNLAAKDFLIETLYKAIVTDRIDQESNSVADSEGTSPYMEIRFTSNEQCVNDFKKIMCFYNFPRCDYTEEAIISDDTLDITQTTRQTFPLCLQLCQTYFEDCKFDPEIISAFCTESSNWPMQTADLGTLNATKILLSTDLDACTGKSSAGSGFVGWANLILVMTFLPHI